MSRRVLSVGQCVPDNASINHFLKSQFDVVIDQSDLPDDTLESLEANQYDLVLINRKLDRDYSDGLDIIRSMKSNDDLKDIPVMLVTNYAEHQEKAVGEGATYGFGKSELGDPAVVDRLRPLLA